MARRVPSPDLHQAVADGLGTGVADEAGSPELDVTAALLARHGLRNWTVDDVARLSETGRATLYRRYGSRDVLIQMAVTRQTRRFFAAVTATVTAATAPLAGPQSSRILADMVAEGMSDGLRRARRSPLGDLMQRDPAAAMALMASAKVLDAATTALADLYLAMTAGHPRPPERRQAEAVAEALVRLAFSFLLIPGDSAGSDPTGTSRRLRDMIGVLVEARRSQPAEHLLQDW